MKSTILLGLTALVGLASAAGVTGKAEGFASGTTGGGTATPVYPTTNDQLVSYLGDSSPRVIIISKTFDFTGTEGTATSSGCAPWGTAAACQIAINQDGWCDNYQPNAPKKTGITYDKAGVLGITVGSNKSLVGVGGAVIKGKGLRIQGVKNVIIQNIEFTDINPAYVWGGDGITLNNVDLVWIDHCTTSQMGRQHIVLGTEADNRVTISNHYFNGESTWSATCDGHHYWGLYFDGSSDLITFKNNYIYRFSGRSPKVAGNTLLHAVNNYWYDYTSTGHAFEVSGTAKVLAEGNVFQNVANEVETTSIGSSAALYTVGGSACTAYLGRACQNNIYGSSGAFSYTNSAVLSALKGKTIAAAAVAASSMATSIPANAGNVL